MLKALATLQTRHPTRDKGATAVEYGLLVALIAAVIITIVARPRPPGLDRVQLGLDGDLMHPAGASARGGSRQRVTQPAAPMVLTGYGAVIGASRRI